ncbi:MAG: tetratricopeptide repeat protein, partial [Candidatus Aegiribacteria sp.]|nr:tetratricopeptide repeat protein [Candidatus Aegiribacteria sp.]
DDHKLEELDLRTRALETRIAFCNLFRVLSKEKRLLIILDDLHWIDSTCLKILEFVIANCSLDSAIMFILLYRPERENGEAVEFDIKPGSADLEEITISEVDDEACRELLVKILSGISESGSGNVAGEVESFLLEHAEGNPFFLEELILDLVESDVIEETNSHWDFSGPVDEIYIPSSLAGLLQSRLDHLPSEWKSVLQKSSVLGVEFQLKLYSRMVEKLSLDFNRSVFRNLELKKFLIGKGTAFEQKYFFRNILIHDTAYNSILESNRKLLHRTAAESVMNLYAEEEEKIAGILVHHWEMAGDIEQAILWGMKALNHAAVSYQHSVILDLSSKLQEWLQELPEQPERNQQLLEVLTIRHVTLGLLGRREEQEKLLFRMYGIAEENLLQEWFVEIQRDLGDLYMETGRMTEAREYYEKARDNAHEACDRSGEGKTLSNLGNLNYKQKRLAEAQECHEKALELHREVGNRKSEGKTLGNLGILFTSQGRTSDAFECYMKALEIHQELGNRRSEGIVYANLGNLHFNKNVLDESRMCYENALRIAMDVGDTINQGITYGNLGSLHRKQNRPEKSLECYNSAIRISRGVGDVVNECLNLGNLGIIFFDQGRTEEALSCYTQAYSKIIKLELGINGLKEFTELRGKLLSSGIADEDIPWPIHWNPPGE